MGHESTKHGEVTARWRTRMDLTAIVAASALALSGLSFYRSYIYTKQQLDVTVTDVSYVTNQGELYMTVAFSNGGNRDAALLRVEPALWGTAANRIPNGCRWSREFIPISWSPHRRCRRLSKRAGSTSSRYRRY